MEDSEPLDSGKFITDAYSTLQCMVEVTNNDMGRAPWVRIRELGKVYETLKDLKKKVINYFKGKESYQAETLLREIDFRQDTAYTLCKAYEYNLERGVVFS